ncbi:hypothetical protein [Micromonospora maritima]|uniref:hypothetical protein n=1 Tax=Micromonospora maritima TaxID=986711 RepID=UPI00379DBF45
MALNVVVEAAEPRDSSAFRTEERAWLLSMLYHEDYRSGPWPAADLVAACAAGNTEAANFALETLRKERCHTTKPPPWCKLCGPSHRTSS